MATIREFLDAHAGELVELRHALHQIPETGLDLPQTQAAVLQALEGLPLEIHTGRDLTSVVAILRGGRRPEQDAPLVLLRGDMDGLPVEEDSGEPFASTNGRMHACGHDLHTSMLVFAARALCAVRDELAGDVLFMFQPGEESHDGAGHMIREGLFEVAGRKPDHAYAIHVWAALDRTGQFATRPGPMLSNSDWADITIRGRGGHGSAPHTAADPVVVMAELITQLQVMVTRQFDMFDPVVVTVGRAVAGTARNVIPATARLELTMRSYSPAQQDKLFTSIERLATHLARAHGCTAEVDAHRMYPVTVNDEAETEWVADVISELYGADRHVRWENPLGGSEDFSRVLAEVPGSFIGLSAVAPGLDAADAPGNHSPLARFADDVLVDGAALLAELAHRRLTRG